MKNKRRKRSVLFKNFLRFVAFVLVISIFLIAFTDGLVRPVLLGYAEKLAEIQATTMINGGVKSVLQEEEFRYSRYVDILKDDYGNIIAVTADTVLLNLLISKMILRIQQDISSRGTLDMRIPAGSITGSAYLIGRGPKIPMSVTVSTAVKHSVTSEFSDAGVNQTLHRMVLHISTSAYVIVPFYTSSTTAEIQVPLTETVIVGKVPDSYTVVIEGTNSDLAGKIFDYSADIG